MIATTLDARYMPVDMCASMYTEAIVPGAITSARFDTATDTPDFLGTVHVSFTTAGRVEIGGFLELALPGIDAHLNGHPGWRLEESFTVSFPDSSSAARNVSYDKNSCILTFILADARFEQETSYTYVLTNVRTPSVNVPRATTKMASRDSNSSMLIRGPLWTVYFWKNMFL